MSISGHSFEEPTGPACPQQTDGRERRIADPDHGRYTDPEIVALLARAEAALLRSRELTATLNDLSRAFADAVRRADEWLAASKLNKRHASDVGVGNHARAKADAEPTR